MAAFAIEKEKTRDLSWLKTNLTLKKALALVNDSLELDRVISFLKPKQTICIKKCVEERVDILAVLPTGFGKSLIFQMIHVYSELLNRAHGKSQQSHSVVVSPLNAIIQQQKKRLGSTAIVMRKNPKALMPGGMSESDVESSQTEQDSTDSDSDASSDSGAEDSKCFGQTLKAGQFQFILGHPEDILDKGNMLTMKSSRWSKSVDFIVIDEAHCVVTWGGDFRPKYRELEQLRAIFPKAVMLGLTATATLKMQDEIIKFLGLKNTFRATYQVDRPNIKYVVKQRSERGKNVTKEISYAEIMTPVLQELKQEGHKFPKTVVYTGLKWCGFANDLGVKILSSGELSSAGVHEIAQFHAPLPDRMKQEIGQRMEDPAGSTRLLFATEAYGMGVDTPDIRRVIHAGVPCTLESYSQETGRAGRDGKPAVAEMHFSNSDIGKTTVTEAIKKYCRLKTCRRQYLSEHFGSSVVNINLQTCRCCDNCAVECKCEDCCVLTEDSPLDQDTSEPNPLVLKEVESLLSQYFVSVNDTAQLRSPLDSAFITGLTPELVSDIAQHYKKFLHKDILSLNNLYLPKEHIDIIYYIIVQGQASIET